ncbi:MAG TPA: hypothetical protein VHK24_06955 [Steroidobacter sp.]|jgi:Ca2+-binding EF-hand superfamily protein|nr:hypothetical protein [Steroidobacter sp.]
MSTPGDTRPAVGTRYSGKRSCGARTQRADHPLLQEITMFRLITLLAATLLSVGAMAQEQPKRDTTMKSTATFDSLDKNADSQISKTEAASDKNLSDTFASLDTNGDGYLSKSEYMAHDKT